MRYFIEFNCKNPFSKRAPRTYTSLSHAIDFTKHSGYLGAASCIILANWGAAWGTWKSGIGLCQMGVNHPNGIIKNLVAIIMAGVLGIYGLIVAIIISGGISGPQNGVGNTYSQFTGWAHLSAGLCCGLSCLAAGGATGVAGETGIVATGLRAELNHAKSSRGMMGMGGAGGGDIVDEGDAGKLYIGSVTILSFSGAIGLYGFIISLIITSSNVYPCEYSQ
jgi:V-type H+-transporting ATPase 16kDa proteolipid subunit